MAEKEAYDVENLGKLRNISLKEYEKEKENYPRPGMTQEELN